MDQLNVDSIVWASAKRDIFWPGQVVERNIADETTSPKAVLTVRFLIEDSYEDIKNQNKIFPWNCENQEKFIGKGRGLKNQQRKLEFNKAVCEADNLSLQQEERLKGNNVGMKRRSAGGETGAFLPRKSPRRHMSSGCSSEHSGTYAKNLTESLISGIKDDNSSLKNGESHKTMRSNIAGKGKDFEITKGSCTVGTCRSKNKNRIADCSLNDESEALSVSEKRGSRRKSSQGESVMSAEKLKRVRNSPRCKLKQGSPEKACRDKLGLTLSREQGDQKKLSDTESRSRRKTTQLDDLKTVKSEKNLGRKRGSSQDESQISTLRKKQDKRLNSLSTRNGHVTTPQRKRQLSVETEPRQKGKSCDQSGLKQETVKSNNFPRTSKEKMLLNGHKNGVDNNRKPETHIDIETAGEGNMKSVGANCSVSSDSASSDDELMTEAFSPSQESSQFSINDIVWAKYFTEPYWPAVIRRLVTGKRKRENKILVQFLGWNNTLFKIQPMKLVHFACDQSQRDEFLRTKEKLTHELQESFQHALGEAEALLNLKGLGKSLNEVDEDDEVVFEEEDDVEEVSEITKESKDDAPKKSSLFQCRKSSRAKKQVSQYGNILSYIRQAKTFLRQILNGTKSSERHLIYTSGRVSEKDNLKHRAGFGPIADDNLRDEIMRLLLQFYEEFKGSPDITYVSEVWLPEALIWSIQQIQHVDRQKAEEMYLEGSKFAVTDDEVHQFTSKLMQKNLSQTEAMERLQKAERVIARVSQ